MPVAGYNVVPDVNDLDGVIGVEVETANEIHAGKACIYIDEEEVHLSYDELRAFIGQARFVCDEMEWNMAAYAYASQGQGDTIHLVHRGNAPLEQTHFAIEPTAIKYEKALCGRPAPEWKHPPVPRGWDISPVIGEPGSHYMCKRCYAKWQKLNQEAGA